MDNYTNTMTAWTPSLGMSTRGHACADDARILGVDAVAAQGGALSIVRVKGAFPGPPAWRPPIG